MARWALENAYDTQVAIAAGRYGVPASLVKAVIAAESGFQAAAVRKETKRATDWPEGVTEDASRGLMQVLNWRALSLGYRGAPEGLHDPMTNIELGTRLLSINAAILGVPWDKAISAYNGGIRPELGFGEPRRDGTFRNQSYVDRVKRYWHYFETGEWVSGGASTGILMALALGFAVIPFFLGLAGNDPAGYVHELEAGAVAETEGVRAATMGDGGNTERAQVGALLCSASAD